MANILALDPAFRNVGWSVWVNGELHDCGVITTSPAKKNISKANAIEAGKVATEIGRLIKIYQIDDVYAELPMGSQSSKAANQLGIITGVVTAVCGIKDIDVKWVSPNSIKKIVAEKELVSKDMVMDWVRENYPNDNYPKTKGKFEHIADSVLVYHFFEKGLDKK